MFSPACFLRCIYRTLKTGVWMDGSIVSGHNMVTDSDPTPTNIHVLVCEDCGKRNIIWSWEEIEK